MKKLSWKEITKFNLSKKGLVDMCDVQGTFDFALPQAWLDAASDRLYRNVDFSGDVLMAYDLLRKQSIWHYPEGNIFGEPVFLTIELSELMEGIEYGDVG